MLAYNAVELAQSCWGGAPREGPEGGSQWSQTSCLRRHGPGGRRCTRGTPRRPCAQDCDIAEAVMGRLWPPLAVSLAPSPVCASPLSRLGVPSPPCPSRVFSPVRQRQLREGSLGTREAEIQAPDCLDAHLRPPTHSAAVLGLWPILSLPRFPCV